VLYFSHSTSFLFHSNRYPLEVRAQVGMGTILSRLNALRSEQRPPVPRSLGVLGACLLQPEYQNLTKCELIPESLFSGMCGSMGAGTLSLVFISAEMKEFMQTRNMVQFYRQHFVLSLDTSKYTFFYVALF